MAAIHLYVAFFISGDTVYKISISSNRIYLDDSILDNNSINQINDTIDKYNSIRFSVYNLIILKYLDVAKYNKILGDRSIHVYVKKEYDISDYCANTLVRWAEGLIKTQITNNKEYIKQYEEQLKDVRKNIKDKQKILDSLIELRNCLLTARTFLLTSNDNKTKKKINKELTRIVKNIKFDNNEAIVSIPFTNKKEHYRLYRFEYKYLNPKIKNLKNQISQHKYRENNLNNKIKRCGTLKRSIFGSKSFMKKYVRGEFNKTDFHDKKYNYYEISGRCDARYGNYVFKPTYNTETNSFDFNITLIDNVVITVNNIKFPYKQEELIKLLNKDTNDGKMWPICFRLDRKKDLNNRYYFQIKATFDIECTTKYINTDTSTGIFAIDFNYGHLDVTELDAKGNLISTKTIYYDLEFNSKQNELSLRKALDEVAELACLQHKIIAVENINTYKSNFKANKNKHKQRVLNYTLHRLPYSRFLEIVDFLRIKYNIDIIIVNPAFTSIIGKLKYSYKYKLSTHIAASYVIGRRALGFADSPLKHQNRYLTDIINKSEWAKWSYLNKIA